MPFPIIAALGAAQALGKIGVGLFQNKKAGQIHPQFSQYQESPYAKMQLGGAQQAYNSRMAGAANMERNIASSQANFMNNVNRNATDGSQVLALAAAGQGQADDSYDNLQTKEAQNKYNLLGNLNSAYAANINEGDKVYNSMLQKYQMDSGAQQALRSSGFNNIFGGVNDALALGIMGGFDGIGGNKTTPGGTPKSLGMQSPQSTPTQSPQAFNTPQQFSGRGPLNLSGAQGPNIPQQYMGAGPLNIMSSQPTVPQQYLGRGPYNFNNYNWGG